MIVFGQPLGILLRTAACVAIQAILFCLAADVSAAQEIGRLYASRPPAGSAFVRVVAASEATPGLNIAVNARPLPIEKDDTASRYFAAEGNKPLSIAVSGRPIKASAVPLPGRFYTIAIRQRDGGWLEEIIDEGSGESNDLKAQLRFFNLAPDCKALLRIVDGPVIFDETSFGGFRSRAINPVRARLRAECHGNAAEYELPQLKSGDHYSLFFRKPGTTIELSGQFDETEPYRER